MHHSLSNTIISAHVRDLQRAMHPERIRKPRLPRIAPRRRTR